MQAINRAGFARVILTMLLMGGGALGVRSARAAAASAASVNVDAGSVLGTIPQAAFGANTAAWDGDLMDGALPGLLRGAGIRALRFPGGSTADNYHWQTNTQSNGGYTNANDSFDNFMGVVQQIGGQPVITVNYGSNSAGTGGGDPNEAAAWVRYANVTRHYGITYWEIGNEVYGNGTYGADWETDLHAQKGPAAYATNALAFIDAMKAADPSIKVGLVLTAPGNWPDGQSPDWNSTVLSAACSRMDFGIIHWYPQGPGNESDSYLLGAPGQIAQMMSTLHAEYAQYCGARASQIETLVTEVNSVSSGPGKQTVGLVNGLFLADTYMSFLEQGVSSIDWWDLHNGITTGTNMSPSLYGSAQYGDYGLFSFGNSSGGASEPANETPFPSYYGLQMLSHLGAPGDQMVSATSSQGLVAAHAVRQANGDLALLLINKDPAQSATVTVSLAGYAPAPTATIYTYGEQSSAIVAGTTGGIGASFSETLAPYSLTTLVLAPSGVTPPPAPSATATQPAATATMPPAATATPVVTQTPPGTGGSPTFSQQTGASVAPDGSVVVNATIADTGGVLSNGIVDLEIYNAANQKVGQRFYAAQTLAPGQSAPYSWTWAAPGQPGQYTVKVGVFGPSWTPLYYWANGAASVAVTGSQQPSATATATQPAAPATTTPAPAATATPVATQTPSGASQTMSFDQRTLLSPPSIAAGGRTLIRVSVINKGAALSNGVIDLEIYNAAGKQVGQRAFTGQSIAPGESAPYVWLWQAPGQTGQYTVKVGVFGPSWSPLYSWAWQAAQITVG